jgi:hypothetical protein
VSLDAANAFLANGVLSSFKEANSVIHALQSRFPTLQLTTPFTKIGSFQTIRHKIEWENVLLEIDHTKVFLISVPSWDSMNLEMLLKSRQKQISLNK